MAAVVNFAAKKYPENGVNKQEGKKREDRLLYSLG
jgi:hypothetical protein